MKNCKNQSWQKPRCGVPSDLPKLIVQELSPELTKPIKSILSNIAKTEEWQRQWKLEHVRKITMPETEDDPRPISLTPCKVTLLCNGLWSLSWRRMTSGSIGNLEDTLSPIILQNSLIASFLSKTIMIRKQCLPVWWISQKLLTDRTIISTKLNCANLDGCCEYW